MWFQKFCEDRVAASAGSRRVRAVWRYQSANRNLELGATARLMAASSKYCPAESPCRRLPGRMESSKATRSKSSWNNNRERMNFVCPQVSQAFGTEFIGAIV